jgi:glycopeptide antibiotics resistance protein
LVISQGLLLAWEFGQKSMNGMYFDFDDIVATLLGAFAWLLVCLCFPMPTYRAA